jgi:hypothetical protein
MSDDADVPIREYVDLRFGQAEKSVDKALAAAEKAVETALRSAEKAVEKAETNAERWRNNANEWRGAMSDRERDFLTRREFYSITVALVAVISIALAIANYGGS